MSGRQEPPFSVTDRRAPRSPLATSCQEEAVGGARDLDQAATPAPTQSSPQRGHGGVLELPPPPSLPCPGDLDQGSAKPRPKGTGPGAVGWTQRHKEVTRGLPATTRPAGLLGQELGSRGKRPGQPPARHAPCRPRHASCGCAGDLSAPRLRLGRRRGGAGPSRLSEAPLRAGFSSALCPGLYPRQPPCGRRGRRSGGQTPVASAHPRAPAGARAPDSDEPSSQPDPSVWRGGLQLCLHPRGGCDANCHRVL